MRVLPINLKKMQTLHGQAQIKGVPYLWDGKPALDPHKGVESLRNADCSGYVRWLVYHSAVGSPSPTPLVLPEGSWEQKDFLLRADPPLIRCPFSEMGKAIKAGRKGIDGSQSPLFIAFIPVVPGVHAGHVYFVNDQETMECYGGHGVGSRAWNTGVLKRETTSVFVWPHVWE